MLRTVHVHPVQLRDGAAVPVGSVVGPRRPVRLVCSEWRLSSAPKAFTGSAVAGLSLSSRSDTQGVLALVIALAIRARVGVPSSRVALEVVAHSGACGGAVLVGLLLRVQD